MKDLIDRQAAIDATWFEPSYTDPLNVLTEVRDRLKALPSAQPKSYREGYQAGFKDAQSERKRGKWIYGEDEYGIDGYHCDKCGFFVPWDYTHKFIGFIKDYHFCPNCGADMRGEQDEH